MAASRLEIMQNTDKLYIDGECTASSSNQTIDVVSPSTEVAMRLRAGQVDINGRTFNINAPFGGFKQSGRRRELGEYGLEEFLEFKSVQVRLPSKCG
jgi:acyl-CoA reductase-like NAD-dependent aldehyde dehydrogenase